MNIKNDIKRNENLKGKIIVISYVLANNFRKKMTNKFLFILLAPIIIIYKFLTDIILGCEIPVSTEIGEGLIIHHGRGLVVQSDTVIGMNVTLRHNTTIGCKLDEYSKCNGSPVIEDNVDIGPNVVIIGSIIIGHSSIIGAGAVVVKNVDPYSVVAGNPAKLIRKIQNKVA